MHKVLIIEDEEFKFRDIKETLNRVLDDAVINRESTRNDGLLAVINASKSGEPYDIVITDNYMPLCSDSRQLEAFGTDIVKEIERRGINCKKVICSSGTVDDINADYSVVRYNQSVMLDDKFKSALKL